MWVHEEPRVALLAELETPLGRMRVLTTHLSFLPWWNGHQLRTLVRRIGPSECRRCSRGDLNLRPRRAARVTGMLPVATGLTFPSADPTVQLDHILVNGTAPCRDRRRCRDAGVGPPRARGRPAARPVGSGEARQGYADAVSDNASVSNVTSASSCTSADDETPSSEPSSALAASPALLSMSSAILVSMV